MHSKIRPNSGALTLKTVSAAVVSALIFSNAYAAGLGKLTVLSSLGQPLRAEIELTSVGKDEAGALIAKLASPEAFKQANIELNPALLSLRFAIEQRADRQLIRVTSSQPLNEPFVDMLLELGGPSGRLVREYTFLLDPPDLRSSQSAQVSPIPVPAIPATRPLQSAVPAESPAASTRRAQPAPAAAAPRRDPAPVSDAAADAAGQYKVKAGDSLARIAGQLKPGGVSLDQMLVALYRENPDAFVGNNMNRLRAGQILSVPTAGTARSIPAGEARDLIIAQSADFNSYRNKLATQVAASGAQRSAESGQTAAGKITAKVEEPATPAGDAKDKLKLSNAGKPASAPAATGAPVSAEELIARDKALAEANARVKELEKNLGEMQKLLELKNKSLADQQKQAEAAKPDAKAPAANVTPAAPVPPVAAVSPSTKEAAPAASAVQQTPAIAAQEKPAEAAAPAVTPPAEKTPPPAVAPASSKPPVPVVKTQAPPPPEPSFVDDLLENPMTLPGVGLLLAGLGALGIYGVRRRKQQKQFEDSIITDSSLKANSLFGSTGGQSVDTNNSVFNSSFAPSTSHLDSNEVDPVAEADVYIAYGRDAQAEEILKEALRTQPDRNAVRLKLLEIYSNRKDLRAFEVLATELYGMTKGEGSDWVQAATLGIGIDPNNPLYAAGKKDKDESASSMVAPTQPLDEEGLATLLASTQPEGQLNSIHALEADSAYFSNSAMEIDKTVELPSMRNPVKTESNDAQAAEAAEPEATAKPANSNELDFDLDGMSFGDIAVPNTITPAAPSEPSAEMASIDFDFLDEPKPRVEEPASPAADTVEQTEFSASSEDMPTLPDMTFDLGTPAVAAEPAAMDFDLPAMGSPREEADAAMASSESAQQEPESASSDPLEFDLSGFNLDLKPQAAEAMPELMLDADEPAPAEGVSAADAEMATKLDLAIAYQEIGDKEGARELLDEVMKGGTSEQSEKAKSLLLELA
ncbi:FimV/HubP family polar landmark protein [Noviherbaspirillum sp.]|jgi:pilus assembly protein FimV|uniref:FimV/HubP family polar landmark protein n=1 Tax=Noviherbaspirillum sp. TaxID=1926288 RepID=UPI002DDDA597|nr:FimV/HubP family polar landmark protein [Noviherbaspirillum sp.]